MTDAKKARPSRVSFTPAAPTEAPKATASRSAARPQAQPAAARTSRSAAKPAAVAPAASAGADRAKPKLVRDSYTIPKAEYALLEGLKQRAAKLTRPTKKSELLRAGIAVLNGLSDKAFLTALERVPSLKTGRPKASPAAAA